MPSAFDAFVTDILFSASGASMTALGDGTVVFEGGARVQAHDAAILAACLHPSGEGLVTGGDDGRLMHVTPAGARPLLEQPGKWFDVVAASSASGLIATASGREVTVLEARDPARVHVFTHERAVAGLAFDAKGRRLAAATYGGVALWYAGVAAQKPHVLKWAGSHVAPIFSPDGRFVVSGMQENALHGWRLADGADMRMGGYPAKPTSLAFMSRGRLLATSGAHAVIVWPFTGTGGPMGQPAVEIGALPDAVVTRVAAQGEGARVAAGLRDGRVWTATLNAVGVDFIKSEPGPPITALAMSADGGRIAWGDEEGGFDVVSPLGDGA